MLARLAFCSSLLALCAVALRGQDRPSPGQGQDHDGRGALAVLRRDGLLFPFASFNRDTWRATWPIGLQPLSRDPGDARGDPEGLVGHALAGSVACLPDERRRRVPRGQRARGLPGVLRPAARPPDDVSLGRAAAAGAGRSVSEGRAGDQRRRAPRTHRDGQADVAGMGADGGVAAEGVRSRRRRDHQPGARGGAVASSDTRGDSAGRSRCASSRGTASPSGEPGWTVSYVEAVRQYPPGPDDKGCGLETLVSGWIHHRDGQLMKVNQLRGEADLLRPCRRHLYAPVRPHPAPEGHATGCFSSPAGSPNRTRSSRSVPRRIRYVLEVFAGAARRCC